jgi:hypothetical protein
MFQAKHAIHLRFEANAAVAARMFTKQECGNHLSSLVGGFVDTHGSTATGTTQHAAVVPIICR